MLREAQGARRYNTQVALTYSEKVVDDFGHASYSEPVTVAQVYASVVRMSATKALMTFQQADLRVYQPPEKVTNRLHEGRGREDAPLRLGAYLGRGSVVSA